MTIAVRAEDRQVPPSPLSFAGPRPAKSPARSEVPPVFARLRSAFGALRALMREPGQLNQVLVFAQAVNAGALAHAAERLCETEEGRILFAEKRRIDRAHVDFAALRRLPDGTLGREYTRFLDDNGIGPEPFEAMPDVANPRVAWIMIRMRQTHDLWHVLTGYTPDPRGEVLLQAFTYAQVRAPSAFLLALFGTLRWMMLGNGHLADLRRAYRRGKSAGFLPTFNWEAHWESPVSDLRQLLSCPAMPI